MAKSIINGLEAIQINEQQCQRAVISCRKRLAKLVLEEAAVVQLCQWITVNLAPNCSFRDAVFSYIPCRRIQLSTILSKSSTPLEIAKLATCRLQTTREAPWAGVTGRHRERRRNFRLVIQMNQILEAFAFECRHREAKGAFPGWINPLETAIGDG